MEKPWLTFTGICAVVIGIVLISVVFGGYSSLMRSQKRIKSVKQMLTHQCSEQIHFSLEIIRNHSHLLPLDKVKNLESSIRASEGVVLQMNGQEDPLDPGILDEFTQVQIQLNKEIAAAVTAMGKAETSAESQTLAAKALEHEQAVFVMARQYNKEARYFNTRTRAFPGAIIAKLFDLDSKYFPEIAVQSLAGGTSNAS